MTDHNLELKTARIRLYGLIGTVVVAILAILAITAAAFVLSFSALSDLAVQAQVKADLAWLVPASIDAGIFVLTLCVLLMSKINGSEGGKRFFVWSLVTLVAISVVGNALHAANSASQNAAKIAAGHDLGYIPLDPWASALFAVIAPSLVLVFTHGVGELLKAVGNAVSEYNELTREIAHSDAPNDPPAEPDSDRVAAAPQPVAAAPQPVAAAPQPVAAAPQPVAAAPQPVAETDEAAASDEANLVAGFAEFTNSNALDQRPVDSIAHFIAPDPHTQDYAERNIASHAAMSEQELPPVAVPPFPVTEDEKGRLLEFVDNDSAIRDEDRAAARMKLIEPHLSYSEIVTALGDVTAPSTAWRRYKRVARAAIAAGFDKSLLPDFEDCESGPEARTGRLVALA